MYPANPLLYDSISRIQRAIHHAAPNKNNYAAAKGIQEMYTQEGGQYVDSKDQVDPKLRDVAKEKEDAKKRKERNKKQANSSGLYLL